MTAPAPARRFRVAVIGAGIGARHVDGYLATPEGFEVAAVCDLDRSRAAALAARAGAGTAAVTDMEAVLADPTVDLVDVCLPPRLHVGAAAAALRAGKHVVCEKPLAGSVAEVDGLARLAAEAGREVIPVYQYRFGRGFAKLRRLIEAGVAGRPFVATVETHWNRLPAYYEVPWRGRRDTELGGAVVSHAIHAHDMLVAALGPVRRVQAAVATRVNAVETEDCGAALLEMESGALVTLSVTLGAAEELSRFRFCFEHLTAENEGLEPYAPGAEPWRFVPRGARTGAEIEAALEGLDASEPESFEGFLRAVHRGLEGRAPLPLTLADARASLELATAIYVASATGEAVALPLAADHPALAGWLPWLPR